MNKAELLEKLDEWKNGLSYFDAAEPDEDCPTPKGVKRYVSKLFDTIEEKNKKIRILEKRIDGLRSWIDKINL